MIRMGRRITGSSEYCCLFSDESEGISDMKVMRWHRSPTPAGLCIAFANGTDAALMHDDQRASERLPNEDRWMRSEDSQDSYLISAEHIYERLRAAELKTFAAQFENRTVCSTTNDSIAALLPIKSLIPLYE